ncbi:unnamed protein product [Lactuca saligna]|uniref:Uncharacterized protein n=1 Tax=Lactuca saligna TaxID=75948 RepID=A0AA35VJP9_LACSI|nr:unnamed protein product [Lactuca saligna]
MSPKYVRLYQGFAEVLVEISKTKKDGEGEGVEVDSNLGKAIEGCSNKNKDEETVEEGLEIIQWKDSNETQSLKKDKVEGKVEKFFIPSFSLGCSQGSQVSKNSSHNQSSSGRMTKKKIKDRVYLGKPSVGSESFVPNVDVIDASLVSFAPPPPIWTLSFEYNDLKETVKYKVFKDNLSLSVSGDRDLKVLNDVDMKPAFEVIDYGADDVDFNDKYGVILNLL